ncbi:unnamed protein product [Trichogramma brassicae]|uniref:Uncharacterized protein n=1 Tax=Trichogramma brassicae TaxID=86971 RepID=A0A6H5IPF2_9HYME|nr:unnamed protein product [Trichogramma brassicae]
MNDARYWFTQGCSIPNRPSQYGGCARDLCDDGECTCTGATWHSHADLGDAFRLLPRAICLDAIPARMSNVTRTPILRSLRVAAAILAGRAQLTHTHNHTPATRQSRRPITSQITLKLTPSLRRLGVGSAPLLGSKLALVRASISCVRRRCVPLPTSGRRCQIVYARVHYFTQACTSPAGRPASRARIITSPCGRSCLTANYLTSTYNHWPLWAISHTYLGDATGPEADIIGLRQYPCSSLHGVIRQDELDPMSRAMTRCRARVGVDEWPVLTFSSHLDREQQV